jgi:hypothetical protein
MIKDYVLNRDFFYCQFCNSLLNLLTDAPSVTSQKQEPEEASNNNKQFHENQSSEKEKKDSEDLRGYSSC